ncbi:hypothetical protein H0H92_014553, partial [Tricholoma furcatifolium]
DAKMAVDDKPTGKVKVEEAEVKKEDEQHTCSFDETCPIIDCRSYAVRDVIKIATLAALADAAADAAIEGRPPPALFRLPNPLSMALLANQFSTRAEAEEALLAAAKIEALTVVIM